MTVETGAAPEVPAANDRGLKHWRSGSFHTFVVTNAISAGVNITLALVNLFTRNYLLVTIETSVVAALVTLVWHGIIREQRARTSHAGGESAVAEQQVDTEMKQLMISTMRQSGDLATVLKVGGVRPPHTH